MGCHAPPPGDLPNPGIEPRSPALQADSLSSEPPGRLMNTGVGGGGGGGVAKSLQSCPTLCDPIDSRPSGSTIPGILQARTLEWAAISFSDVWKWKVKVKSLSRVWLFATPWTAAYQAPPSTGFSRQEYWSGLPLLSPAYPFYRDLPNLGIELGSPALQVDSLLLRHWGI